VAKVPDKILETIQRYLQLLQRNNIPIQRAVLFGSYANGNFDEWSDIDIALVSDIFEGVRTNDRDKIRKYTLSISSDLQVLPFHPKHFTPEDPLVKEILETGITII
jgi:predicted nucleotidyltransferase